MVGDEPVEPEAVPPASSALPWEDTDDPEPALAVPAWARRPERAFEPDPWARLEREESEPDPSDPWGHVVAASGYEDATPDAGTPSPVTVFRGFGQRPNRAHASTPPAEVEPTPESEFRVQRGSRPSDPASTGLPPDDDVLLRAFESHASRPLDGEDADNRADASASLDSLLGRQGADLLDEVSATPIERPLFARPTQSPVPNAAVDVGPRAEYATVQSRSGWNFADEDPSAAIPLTAAAAAGTMTLEGAPAQRGARGRVVIRELVETGLLAILVFLAVRASFQNFKVDGTSMLPTLENGQFLIVNKLVYSEVDVEKLSRFIPFLEAGDDPKRNLFHGPQRGEIVVLQDPRKPNTDLIKRVIGLPGDTIEIIDGKVYINDYYLEEPYIKRTWHYTGPKTVIPAGQYFVMGDNRDNSLDSRSPLVGLVSEDLIIGKAFVSYWPSSQIGLAPNATPKITEIKSPSSAQAK